MSRIGKSIEAESRLLVARGWREGEMKGNTNGYRVSFWDDANDMQLDSSDG